MLVEEAQCLDEEDLKAAEEVAMDTISHLKELGRDLSDSEQQLALVCVAYCRLFDEHGPRTIH